ncbi:MAG TPA: hypothetical protein VFQ70_03900, partial [Candidatus Saccharimonadaceae bacterium]|nr:hypothetical protein [Candidatus Saccharimonadaceae bacterium]
MGDELSGTRHDRLHGKWLHDATDSPDSTKWRHDAGWQHSTWVYDESVMMHLRLYRYFWDRPYRSRAVHYLLALLIIFSVFIPIFSMISDIKAYAITPATERLIGQTNSSLSAKFHYNQRTDQWQFNPSGIYAQASAIASEQHTSASGIATALARSEQKSEVGGTGKSTPSLYSANLAVQADKGVTYFDNNTNLSFTVAPEFSAGAGKLTSGRIVYPMAGGQLIYTARGNGLKEDIVLQKNLGNTQSFRYKLSLPDTLVAHVTSTGEVGVYSANPALFGSVQASSSADQAKIADAQRNAPKTHLVFVLPSPVIKDKNGQVGQVRYQLHGDQLTVVASDLAHLSYPLSVDPSVVVTSTSDFSSGNNEGMISYNTADQVTRDGLTGGAVGSWTATTSLPQALQQTGAFAYQGYVYVFAGVDASGSVNTVYSAPINSGGTLGTWQSAGTAAGSGNAKNVMVYNGRVYDVGDFNSASGVEYATLSSGTVGSWTAGTALPTKNNAAGAAIYEGRMYLVGGGASGGGGSYFTTVYYANINGDGSVGAWQTATALPIAVGMGVAVAYGNTLYLIGGALSAGGFNTTVYQAPINADGSVGAWTSSSTGSLFGPKYGQYSFAYDGYLYYIAGWTNMAAYYAPINANGSLGAWQQSTNVISTTGLRYVSGAVSGGTIYLFGG